MADEEKNDVAVQETESDSQQTLTMDEVNKLVEEKVTAGLTENNKKWQSNFDKLRAEKEEILKEKEKTEKSWEEKLEERQSALESQVNSWKDQATYAELKSEAVQRVSSAGLDLDDAEWDIIYHLIDKDGDDPLARVDTHVSKLKDRLEKTEYKTREEGVKKNGRKVTETQQPVGATWNDYSQEQIDNMSEDEWKAVKDRSR